MIKVCFLYSIYIIIPARKCLIIWEGEKATADEESTLKRVNDNPKDRGQKQQCQKTH